MRAYVALWLVGCSGSPHADPVVDAPEEPPDVVAEITCSAPPGSANVVVHTAPAQVYDHAYAGGVLLSGPVAVAGVPFSLKLVFAKESPLPICCASPGSGSCCGIVDVLRAESDALERGGELGSHPATISGAGFSAPGTLTITDWVQPFDTPPGHVAGSLSVTIGSVTIDGTFDDTFCADMLSVPI